MLEKKSKEMELLRPRTFTEVRLNSQEILKMCIFAFCAMILVQRLYFVVAADEKIF